MRIRIRNPVYVYENFLFGNSKPILRGKGHCKGYELATSKVTDLWVDDVAGIALLTLVRNLRISVVTKNHVNHKIIVISTRMSRGAGDGRACGVAHICCLTKKEKVLERGGEMFRKCRQSITRTRTCGQRRKCSVLCDFIIMKNYCRLWIVVPEYCFANKLW